MRRLFPVLAAALLVAGIASVPRHLESRAAVAPDFAHFESAHVHPAALTPSGDRLLVVNTSDGRLAVFDVTGAHPVRTAEIAVGLEPVSVAAASDSEAWVVNQLSDDVSIVDLETLHVRATLRVRDEPADVVFANGDAYVSVSQADVVRVYDPKTLALLATIPIDSRMPRALAKSADGTRVFVTGFHAGNRTSVLSEAEAGDSLPPPNPPRSPSLPPAPKVGLIIQQLANGNWVDETGRLWSAKARYTVLDADLSEISTATRSVSRTFGGIGTVNFALAASASGTVAVTATEARNLTRFEPNVRGHMVDTRAAYVASGGTVTLSNLDPHVDYAITPGPQSERDSAIGIPSGAAWSADGRRLYVTSLASDKIAVLDPAQPNVVLARVPVVAGPTGIVADDARGRLYVVGRFHNQLQTLSSADFSQIGLASIGFDPTPDAIVNGRKFFYGGFTSGHGDQACATCHLFGDFDNIAWDLGNPQGTMQPVNTTGQQDPLIQSSVHPMKGPMTTQSLRGLPPTGMFHWRADRLNLDAFNPAFVNLMGRAGALADSEMAAFDDFVLPLAYPPNPNQFLDRTLPGDAGASATPSAKRGQSFFMTVAVDGGALTCNQCHGAGSFGPGTNGQIIDRFALQEAQDMKVPQLRNMYKKTGFTDQPGAVNKRGFGFTHNGAVDNLFDFLQFPGFNFGSPQSAADAKRRDVEQFLLCFDTGIAPAVGCEVTFAGANDSDPTLVARLDTLAGQAGLGYCDLVAKGRVSGQPRGWLYVGGGMWRPDKQAEGDIATATLRALGGPGSEVTVRGVPPGSGTRMGLDRDRDGYRDGDELDAGSDPGNPRSTPANVAVEPAAAREEFALRSIGPNPFRSGLEVAFTLGRAGAVDLAVYDALGREVRAVARGMRFDAGPQSLAWDGRDARGREAGAGIYFVRLRTERATWTRVVMRVR
ncbi:MAG TPA: beta-propeller fold lactonase family protein [Candidatus Eisenbacteria bacterium]|jgi:YVTN family beta-propeller protein